MAAIRIAVGFALALAAAGFISPAAGQEPRIILLGTGTPNADPARSGPATAVLIGGRAFIVDAGPGVVRRAAAAAAKWSEPALLPPGLTTVLLTHLHSDHTLGLPDLLLSPWTLERTEPLTVIGPPGTRRLVTRLADAFRADVENRLGGLEPANRTGYRARAEETKGGVVYRDSLVTITAVPVPHANWETSLAYRFDAGSWRAVISGDTRPSDALVTACGGCDILVHEVYSAERLTGRPADWQVYHRDAHTSTVELAAIAERAGAKLLVLTHQLFWGASPADLVREIVAAGYSGVVRSGEDLDRYPVRAPARSR
jgi:ribonuclease BN (tRNA processing enzyme)